MSVKPALASDPSQKVLKSIGYRIGRTIGKGNFSKVCVAINKKGQKLACKMIKKKLAGEDYIDKFIPREIDIVTSIKHPNIIQVYKILESDDVIYMLMDYCKLGDLLEYIRDYGRFSEKKAKFYFKQIVEAVSYLHNLDIAHRDLKCENVFLTASNQVKLGDFGFARSCKDTLGHKILSDTFCGSAAYAAPEILKGRPYDPKMYDMWALGCILYIMLTASMPFDDVDIRKMIRSQLSRSIFGSNPLWTEFSIAVRKLLNALLEPDLNLRISVEDARQHAWFKDEKGAKLMKMYSFSDSLLF